MGDTRFGSKGITKEDMMGVFSAANIRTFGGKLYRKWGGYRTKAEATGKAKERQKEGYYTRIVKAGDHYVLYQRKK